MTRATWVLFMVLALDVISVAQTVTPNIGLQVPNYNQANWQVPINYDLNLLDLLLSGNQALPALTVTGALNAPNFTISQSAIISALGYTPLNPANNLSDVDNKGLAFTNLGGVSLNPSGSQVITQPPSTVFQIVGNSSLGSLSLSGPVSGFEDEGSQVFNVKAYGATGNGTINDTTAIQSTITAAENTGGIVYLPPGNYIACGLISNSYYVSFEGAGKQTSELVAPSSGCSGDILEVTSPENNNNSRGGFIEHLGVVCSSYSSQNGIHALAWGLGHLYQDFYIQGCDNALFQENPSGLYTEETKIEQGIFSNNIYAVHLEGHSSGNSSGYQQLDFYCERNNQSVAPWTYGSCLYVDGTDLYNSHIKIRVNLSAASTPLSPNVVAVDDFGSVWGDDIQVYGEGAANSLVFAVGDSTLVGQNMSSQNQPVVFNSTVDGATSFIGVNNIYGNWAASTVYSVGTVIKSSCAAGDFMQVQEAGTSGTSAPSWNCGTTTSAKTLDLTTDDGTGSLVWRDVGNIPGYNGGIPIPIASAVLDGPFGQSYIDPQPLIAGACTGQGTLIINQAGGSGTTLYVCESGTPVAIK